MKKLGQNDDDEEIYKQPTHQRKTVNKMDFNLIQDNFIINELRKVAFRSVVLDPKKRIDINQINTNFNQLLTNLSTNQFLRPELVSLMTLEDGDLDDCPLCKFRVLENKDQNGFAVN